MIEDATIGLIDKVGVAVAAFIMMYALYIQTQKWYQKQQEKTEARFDKLVECFITTIREITEAHNGALIKHSEALEKHTAKLDEHVRLKDEFIETIKEERRMKAHG